MSILAPLPSAFITQSSKALQTYASLPPSGDHAGRCPKEGVALFATTSGRCPSRPTVEMVNALRLTLTKASRPDGLTDGGRAADALVAQAPIAHIAARSVFAQPFDAARRRLMADDRDDSAGSSMTWAGPVAGVGSDDDETRRVTPNR